MKKYISLTLSLVMLLSLAACGGAASSAAQQANMNTDYMDPAATAALIDAQYAFCTDTVSSVWE